jgi:hypothetical protein
MHLLLTMAQRKVPAQFLGLPSGARHRRRFSILHSARKRNSAQFLSKVPAAEVNHVAIESPITQTKWYHIPIAFSTKDVNLALFPHTDVVVLTVHIDRWDVSRILINNGSQAEILFLSAFKKWATTRSLKVPATFGIINVFSSQKEARSIKRSFAPWDKNVHFLREDADQHK